MFSIRRMVASLMVGGVALALAAGQAGAASVSPEALARAAAGVERGLAAAEARLTAAEAETLVLDTGLSRALEAVNAAVERRLAAGNGNGQGPVHAADVLEALQSGESPSELAPGRLEKIAKAYKELKAQADEHRAAGGGQGQGQGSGQGGGNG
jgi:hypothetical protein